MRPNLILAAVVVLLAVCLVVQSARTNGRIAKLEAELELMDTNLKQFAMPMDDLRSDIAGIFAELDALESERSRPRQSSVEPAEEEDPQSETVTVRAPVYSAPPVVGTGVVYTGDYGVTGRAADKTDYNAPPDGGVQPYSLSKVVDEDD